uniref:DWNN domain-containing protein n=1 Tax=Macrostomum lignano TaxID=282301 RepID=A0A1I8F8J7_9PLAT
RIAPSVASRSQSCPAFPGALASCGKSANFWKPRTRGATGRPPSCWRCTEDTKSVLVHYHKWSAKFDEEIEMSSERLRPLNKPTKQSAESAEAAAFQPGDLVLARASQLKPYDAAEAEAIFAAQWPPRGPARSTMTPLVRRIQENSRRRRLEKRGGCGVGAARRGDDADDQLMLNSTCPESLLSAELASASSSDAGGASSSQQQQQKQKAATAAASRSFP